MEKTRGIPDRIAGAVVAIALLVVGAVFMVLGVSLLPVIGIFIGFAFFGFAWHFLAPKGLAVEYIAGFVIPRNVRFHPGHAWARMGKDDTVTVGMDDFAARLLGSADSISLPEPGSRVRQGSLGWGFKTDSRVINMLSPVDGEVVAVNREAVDSPALAFSDPYGKGWLFKVANGHPTANREKMVPESKVAEWFESIRETLFLRRPDLAEAGLLQDGGEPVFGLAKAIDPQGWDDLAREFLLTR